LESRSLPVLILTIGVFIGLIFSPSFSFLSNNYVVYQYQSAAAKSGRSNGHSSSSGGDSFASSSISSTGKSHKNSDFSFPFSSSPPSFDNANPITAICPDGSPPTDNGKCKSIQPSDSENPMTTVTTGNTKDNNNNDKNDKDSNNDGNNNNNKHDYTPMTVDSTAAGDANANEKPTHKSHSHSDPLFSPPPSFDNSNPITIVDTKKDNNNNNNNKDTSITTSAAAGDGIQQAAVHCKKGKHFDAILNKCVKDISPASSSPPPQDQQLQKQTPVGGETPSTPKQDITKENPLRAVAKVFNKKLSSLTDGCKVDLHLGVKKDSCTHNDKTSSQSPHIDLSKSQTDNTGSGTQAETHNGITTAVTGGGDSNNNNKDGGNNNDNNNKDTTGTAVTTGTTATATTSTSSSTCPDGSKPSDTGKCNSTDEQCPKSFFFLNHDANCIPDKKCPKGFETHGQDETGTCYPVIIKVDCKKNPNDRSCPRLPPQPPSTQHISLSCPKGSKLVNGKCQVTTVVQHQQTQNVVIVKTQIDTVTKNFIINNIGSSSSSSSSSSQQGKQQQQHTTFLLLLDTAQLCQIAGDTQCVAKQNQFKTLNLVTKPDSATTTAKSWSITGQAENIASAKTQRNVQLTVYFYDSKGNNVGGSYKGSVNPGTLKSLQSGAFNFKASTSAMKGTPSFLRLEYQATAS
jgi:hypothetical protein